MSMALIHVDGNHVELQDRSTCNRAGALICQPAVERLNHALHRSGMHADSSAGHFWSLCCPKAKDGDDDTTL